MQLLPLYKGNMMICSPEAGSITHATVPPPPPPPPPSPAQVDTLTQASLPPNSLAKGTLLPRLQCPTQ